MSWIGIEGSDENDGSYDHPFKTLKRAQEANEASGEKVIIIKLTKEQEAMRPKFIWPEKEE